MGNNVGGVDPYEGYRVEPAGSQKNRPSGETPPPDPRGFLARWARALLKKIETFLEKTKQIKPEEQDTLKKLKAALLLLQKEDRSQDLAFLNDLSEHWNRALQESLAYPPHTNVIFKIFVDKILHYPAYQTHTFGYYLTEHAGQKWIPFPYMELMQKIHQEHQKNPTASALLEWVRLLDDTLRSFGGK